MAFGPLLVGTDIFTFYRQAKKKYPDFDTWIAEAIRAEYGNDYVDPLMTAKICSTKRLPWEDPVVFEKVCVVINGRPVLADLDQDITIKEISFAIDVLKEEFPKDEFNDSVAHYVAAQAGEEGMCILPDNLLFAQRFIPNIFLNDGQRKIQQAYLDEVADYATLMKGLTLPKEAGK